jgi:anthranilate synthase/aminodeoxychorismate synthase-like glutamine amidotransferase
LLIDNYDSFTFNLAQALQGLGARVEVLRNDEVGLGELETMPFTHLAISPGPGVPSRSGVVPEALRRLAGRVPVLGICLGHQAIGECFGARLVRAPRPVHGKTSAITHDGKGLFRGVENPLTATRYHSLVLERDSIPGCLEITALSEDGLVMGIRHPGLGMEGLQFHPESVLTPQGELMLRNFVEGGERR